MKKASPFPTSGVLRLSASAGSGKTYSLTQLYLQKVLKSPTAFRSVVAITFTNKAANELKQRIVNRLYELSQVMFAEKVYSEFGYATGSLLAESSKKVLLQIVHDFDAFRVMTIDSFFQLLFSQVAFDAGLPHGLEMELDQNRVKAEVLEAGLQSMEDGIRQILLDNVMSRLSEKGKGWRPVTYLQENLMNSLFQGEVLDFQYAESKEWLQDEQIAKARSVFEQYLREENQVITDAAIRLRDACLAVNITTTRFDKVNNKDFHSELHSINQLALGIGERTKRKASNARGKFWRPSKEVPKDDLDSLSGLLVNLYDSLDPARCGNIALAESILNNLSAIRLLVYFRSVLSRLNLESSRILLQEVKYILRGIIAGSDVPYLYEKLGNQLSTLMIDEFQDTDSVQWAVLAPLAKAIVDQGGFFAVVGDVKQSIYGWRGGESSLFKVGVDAALYPKVVEERPLETNYRSHGRIVHFNNWLFTHLSDRMAGEVLQSGQAVSDSMFLHWNSIYQANYQDVMQLLKKEYADKTEEGFVELRVHSKKSTPEGGNTEEEEESEEAGFGWIVKEIIRLQKAGIEASEIAVLVRNNKDLAQMVRHLDVARREGASEADFTFTAQSGETMNDHLLIRFLALAIQITGYATDFQYVQMEKLARSLGLDSGFWSGEPGEAPHWRVDFKNTFPDRMQSDLLGCLDLVYRFFQLAQFPEHQFAYITFKNLILKYLQKDAEAYLDFTQWWINKASAQKPELPEASRGIQILTIHKSKGLDFGVVILAINSNSKTDSLVSFDFWPKGEGQPWNSYPLLKSRAKSAFLNSDLAQQFENQIYKQILENLNLWYVALTRPRYGLIIDICLASKENLNPPSGQAAGTKLSRLAFQVPFQILENQADWSDKLSDSTLEVGDKDSAYLMQFQYGTLNKPSDQMDQKIKPNGHMQKPSRSDQKVIPWAKVQFTNSEVLVGSLTHKVLEKCVSAEMLPNVLKTVQIQHAHEHISTSVWESVAENLQMLFGNEHIKSWFSGQYAQLPEQELVDAQGMLLRADRILIGKNGYVILDFKTGQLLDSHGLQIRNYAQILKQIVERPVKAYLAYTLPMQIQEVEV